MLSFSHEDKNIYLSVAFLKRFRTAFVLVLVDALLQILHLKKEKYDLYHSDLTAHVTRTLLTYEITNYLSTRSITIACIHSRGTQRCREACSAAMRNHFER